MVFAVFIVSAIFCGYYYPSRIGTATTISFVEEKQIVVIPLTHDDILYLNTIQNDEEVYSQYIDTLIENAGYNPEDSSLAISFEIVSDNDEDQYFEANCGRPVKKKKGGKGGKGGKGPKPTKAPKTKVQIVCSIHI